MVNIADFFAQPTRFQIQWPSFDCQDAISWAEATGTNYFAISGRNILSPRPGIRSIFMGSGGIDQVKLRAANLQANNEMQRKHEADMEISTGTDILTWKKTKWFLATRGQKLRTIAAQRNLYHKELNLATDKKAQLMESVRAAGDGDGEDNPLKSERAKKLREAIADWSCYLTIMKILNEVEVMVVAETQASWDWKAGLRQQLDKRNVLYALTWNLSDEAMETFAEARSAINCF